MRSLSQHTEAAGHAPGGVDPTSRRATRRHGRLRMTRRPRILALFGSAVLILAGVAVPATPAMAAVACDVTYQAMYWNNSPRAGGFQANITIANLGDPINGWTLGFTLPAGQSFRNGWGAEWRGTGGPVTASSLPWNSRLGTGQQVSLGFTGRWTGGVRTDPTTFTVNGIRCAGAQPPANRPPTATLTSPVAGQIFTLPGTMRLAATASDPDDAVNVVQFFVNETLVGTDESAPYEIIIPSDRFGFVPLTAWARALDNGSPPLSGDSARVPFQVIEIPPVAVIAAPSALTIVEGGTGGFDLRLSAPVNAVISLTVTGASGVSVTPTSVTLGPGQPTQRITVTAAPGSGGSVATITAAADPTQVISAARVTVTVLDGPG
jgi:cellulose 1,4-beta-cellobiosidase